MVPDTNVLVSGVIAPRGNPAFPLDCWRNGEVQLITSFEILREFERVMQEKLRAPREEVEIVKAFLVWKGRVVEPKQRFTVVQDDPSDNKFLEAAVEGNADFIVSGDKHLKSLKNFKEIQIVSPAEMAAILRGYVEGDNHGGV
ncbi:MAG: putative toxin-antitoxin system toxin component, PIN family [Chloroflexi bacterium]|nr:putative toxin-antitoxin system toxin component, PIN family [Chloroflexota bacterium]